MLAATSARAQETGEAEGESATPAAADDAARAIPESDTAKEPVAPPKKIPESGFAFNGRLSYETWLTGSVAGERAIGDVFGAGPGTQLDIGIILGKGVAFFVGWQHTFYTVGNKSPYANLPTTKAYGNYVFGGLRYGCGNDDKVVGPWLGADLGYLALGATGSDNSGGSAEVSIPNFAVRGGLGLCIRPTSRLMITPGAMLGLVKALGSHSGSVTVGSKEMDTSGDVMNDSLILSVSPGLSITGEL